jgi:two-component system cell cycle response regulator DivK
MAGEASGAKQTILIVEDNDANLRLLTAFLTAHGYAICGAADGPQATNFLSRERPNLILMDVQLPEISGIDILKWLRADPRLNSVPVVAITAFAMRGDRERLLREGFDDYMAKPMSLLVLLDVVRRFITDIEHAE